MADQQNLEPPEQDHLEVAKRLMDRAPGSPVGPAAAQVHVLIDIAESLRHLRPQIVISHAEELSRLQADAT